MWERIDSIRQFAGTPQGKAALTALAVFAGLYLAVGIGLFGFNVWSALTWPYWVMRWFLRATLLTLAAFAGAALCVYWLRLRLLLVTEEGARHGLRVGALEGELAGLREQAERSREELGRCRGELRIAVQARKDAEIRALAAEENARRGAQRKGAGQNTGGDENFQATKRAFARLYHPDNNTRAEGLDKLIRTEIFKEFWRELEAIQKGGRK